MNRLPSSPSCCVDRTRGRTYRRPTSLNSRSAWRSTMRMCWPFHRKGRGSPPHRAAVAGCRHLRHPRPDSQLRARAEQPRAAEGRRLGRRARDRAANSPQPPAQGESPVRRVAEQSMSEAIAEPGGLSAAERPDLAASYVCWRAWARTVPQPIPGSSRSSVRP
jgi:hypothetical protein